jgi:hypothetical protein
MPPFAPPSHVAPAIPDKHNVCMDDLHFDWNTHEAAANVKKHGVSFEEA